VSTHMTLNKMLEWLECPTLEQDYNVLDLISDTRQFSQPLDNIKKRISEGCVFIALQGINNDGRDYVVEAEKAGAVAVLAEAGKSMEQLTIPVIEVPNFGNRLGDFINYFFGFPSKKISIVGVTGTNGKTSCCHLISQLLQHMGKKSGVAGTLGVGVYPQLTPALNTTADILSTQKFIGSLVERSVGWLNMEVSSHALEQGRTNGILFNTAVFTNIGRDHLDYHKTIEAYVKSKVKLFEVDGLKNAVINIDDAKSDVFIRAARQNAVFIITYSITGKDADVELVNIKVGSCELKASLISPWGNASITTYLGGLVVSLRLH